MYTKVSKFTYKNQYFLEVVMNWKGFQENFPVLWNELLFAMCLIFMT